MSCNCYIARHPLASKIDAALLAMEDPRAIAERFQVGKSRVYEHRGHLKATGAAFVAVTRPETSEAPAPRPEPEEPVKAIPVPAESHREPTPPESPAVVEVAAPIPQRVEWRAEPAKVASSVAPTAAPPHHEPPREPPPAVIPRVDVVHGIVESSVPQSESGERVEGSGETHATIAPIAQNTARALTTEKPSSSYAKAVEAALSLLSAGEWRPRHIEGLAGKFGLTKGSARNAYSEAVRHVHLDMGGYLEKLAASAMLVMADRDVAKAESKNAKIHAERWRRQEREAQEAADKLEGKERFAMLETAARFGMLATKYDLSAEKWSAQALSHQRHLDDVLCLRGPKEATQNVFHIGANDMAKFEAFGRAMAARFASEPEVLRAIEEAAGAVMLAVSGDAAAITTTGEAA